MIKLLKRSLKKYIGAILCVVLVTVLHALCELSLPKIMADIVDIGLTSGGMSYIVKHGLLMLGMALGQMLTLVLLGYMSSRISSSVGKDLRKEIFSNALTFSLTDLNKFTVSSMIVRNTNDVTVIQNFVVMLLRMVLMSPVMCIGSIIIAFRINTQIACLIMAAVPVLALFFSVVIFYSSKLFVLYRKKLDKLNLLVREHLSGTRVIRAFVSQKTEKEKFERGNEETYDIALKINRILSSVRPFIMLTINITTLLICYVGIGKLKTGVLTVGQIMSLVTYVLQILMSLSILSFIMITIPRTKVSAKRINEVLDTQTSIISPENSQNPEKTNGTVEFKDVTFAYPDSEQPVINNVSFTAEGGKTTAIIGSTGSGKSTLQRLIIRLYDVSQGAVLCDGIDVRNYNLKSLREKIGYIPQRAVLFSGTIADNMRFGCQNATDEQIIEALKTAQAWEFVSKKDGQLSSFISQGGKNFSGGQKQRLAIARALIKPCDVLIFDDSFSALDYETDAKLRMALNNDERLKKTTKIIIAQRISTVMNADKIIVLDNGEIVGQGTHSELLKNCKLYYEIASSQLSEEELTKGDKN